MSLAFSGPPVGEGFARQGKCAHRTIDRSPEYDRWKNDGRAPTNFRVINIQKWAIVRLARAKRPLNVACSRTKHRGNVQYMGDLLMSSDIMVNCV